MLPWCIAGANSDPGWSEIRVILRSSPPANGSMYTAQSVGDLLLRQRE
jgi:hypothetical protein